MNVHQKPKHAVYFARQWLEDVLTQCRQIAGLLQHFRTNGHINARYTSLNMEDEDIRKYKLEYLLRIEINKAMGHAFIDLGFERKTYRNVRGYVAVRRTQQEIDLMRKGLAIATDNDTHTLDTPFF